MKVTTIIFIVLFGISLVFAVLYWVKPREVVVDIERTALDKIPDEISVDFDPAPPDTTWKITVAQLKAHIKELEKVRGYSIVSDKEFRLYPPELVVSKKTFRETLLSAKDLPLVTVSAHILAYGETPVNLFENVVSIMPNKENLIKEYLKDMRIPKPNSKFWTGVGWGAGITAGAILAGHLTGVF